MLEMIILQLDLCNCGVVVIGTSFLWDFLGFSVVGSSFNQHAPLIENILSMQPNQRKER